MECRKIVMLDEESPQTRGDVEGTSVTHGESNLSLPTQKDSGAIRVSAATLRAQYRS